MEPSDDLTLSISNYIEEHFAEYGITPDWDDSRGVLSFRMMNPEVPGEPLVIEFAPDFLACASPEDVGRRLDDLDVEDGVKDQLWVRVREDGLEPLPGPDPAPMIDPVEEASKESFPASDPPPHSAISRTKEPENC